MSQPQPRMEPADPEIHGTDLSAARGLMNGLALSFVSYAVGFVLYWIW